jgi:hypothetical protein
MIDAPEDKATAVIAPPDRRASSVSSQGIPLILQISSLPRSSDLENFFYSPYASLVIHHGHVVVYHDCPDAMAFQDLYPSANIGYISLLPKGLFAEAEGHRILESQQRALLRASASQAMVPAQAPPPVTPP